MNRAPILAIGVCLVIAACSNTRRVGLDGGLIEQDAAAQTADGPTAKVDIGARCEDCRLLVGLLVSESGALAGTQHGIIKGAHLACDEINAAGGVLGMKVGLRIEDDGTAAESAERAFSRLADDPSVLAIIGPTSSAAAFAVAKLADQRRIAVVSVSATGDRHTAPPPEQTWSPFFFRTVGSELNATSPTGDNAIRRAVSAATNSAPRPKGRVVRVDQDDGRGFESPYGLLSQIIDMELLTGVRFSAASEFSVEDFADIADKALKEQPAFVVLGTLLADGAALTRALKEKYTSGYRPVLIGHWPSMFEAFLEQADPEATEGMVGIAPRPPGHALQYATFANAYRAAWRQNPPLFAEGAYDAAYLIAFATAQAGGAVRERIPDAMRALSAPPGAIVGVGRWREGLAELGAHGDIDYDGAAGPLDWDWRGEPNVPDSRVAYVVYRVKAGRIELVPGPETP